jgi:hypothetical protein
MVFDGAGHFDNHFTVNDNGVVTRGFLISDYHVDADCRGSTHQGTVGDLIVLENGEEFFTISAAPGGLIINLGFGKRIGPARGDDDHDGDD